MTNKSGTLYTGVTNNLERRVYDGTSPDELEMDLAGALRDKGVVYWGGTGLHTLYFLLDGNVLVAADISPTGRISGEPVARRAGRWRKQDDGTLELPLE